MKKEMKNSVKRLRGLNQSTVKMLLSARELRDVKGAGERGIPFVISG